MAPEPIWLRLSRGTLNRLFSVLELEEFCSEPPEKMMESFAEKVSFESKLGAVLTFCDFNFVVPLGPGGTPHPQPLVWSPL